MMLREAQMTTEDAAPLSAKVAVPVAAPVDLKHLQAEINRIVLLARAGHDDVVRASLLSLVDVRAAASASFIAL